VFPTQKVKICANFVTNTREEVHASDKQQMLVAVAWGLPDCGKIFNAFPETLFVDGTHKTNAEGWVLMTASVKDSHGEVHIVFRAFVPNERNWLFRWLFQTAFVHILGARMCKKVRLVITDGDSQEIAQLDAAIRTVFCSARRRRCGWHIVVKGFQMHVTTMGRSPEAKKVMKKIQARLYSMMKDVESEEEYQE